MICPSCRTELPGDADYCTNPECRRLLLGTTQTIALAHPLAPAPGAHAATICPRAWCAASVPEGQATCPGCGESVMFPHTDTARSLRTRRRVVQVKLTDGQVIRVACPSSLVLGRDAPELTVSEALDPYLEVSRQHAELVVQADGVHLRDLGSTNGTFVDGTRVGGPISLGVGRHMVRLGPHVVIDVDIRDAK
jgi:hypothetical protein